jgi:hypothetical protein
MLKKTLLGIAAATVITVSAMAGTTTQASAGGFKVYLTHGYDCYYNYCGGHWGGHWGGHRGHWGGKHHSRGHRRGHSGRHNRGHRRGNRRGRGRN